MVSLRKALGLLFACWLAGSAVANDVAVVVGVSDYRSAAITDLKYADDDARLFAKTIVAHLGFAKEDVILLTSAPKGAERLSTASNILAALDEVARRQRDATNSKFVFFFSGHGVDVPQGSLAAACDYDPSKPFESEHRALLAGALAGNLGGRNVNLAWAIFDICRPHFRAANNADRLRPFALGTGKARLVATTFSSIAGPSFESDEFKQGYFTHYLCAGLTPRGMGRYTLVPAMDARGKITVGTLHEYVHAELVNATKALSSKTYTPSAQQPIKKDAFVSSEAIGLSAQRPSLEATANSREFELAAYDPRTHEARTDPAQVGMVLRSKAFDAFDKKQFAKAAVFFEAVFEAVPDTVAASGVGASYFHAGSLEAAETWYRRALEHSPKNSNVQFNLGVVNHKQGQHAEAEAWYLRAIEADPQNADALGNLGNLKEGAEAELWYLKALAAQPKLASAMFNLGNLKRLENKPREAEVWFRKAIQAAPDHLNAMHNLGAIRSSLGDVVEAESWYRKVLAASPGDADTLSNLGNLKFEQKKVDEAESFYQQALKSDPRHVNAINNLAVIRQQAGRLDEAEDSYRKGLAIEPTPEALYNLGTIRKRQDRPKEAEEWYRKALELDSKHAKSMNQLGVLSKSQGQFSAAEEWYLKAITAMPDYSDAQFNLGLLKDEQGKLEEAERWYLRSLQAKPDRSDALNNMGLIKKAEKKLAEAEMWLSKAIDARPDYVIAMFNLVNVLHEQERFDEAERWCLKIIALQPAHAPAFNHIGGMKAERGKYAEAESWFVKAAAAGPTDGLYLANLAYVLLKQGKREEALAAAQRAKALGFKDHPVYKELGIKIERP